ncbi:MAG: enolase C-terminal domain-like protein [Candidatus Micrarchaeaceae archaeon]
MESWIKSVALRKIFDSRGLETIEATVTAGSGISAVASAPSGTSRSIYEAEAFPKGDVELGIKRFNAKSGSLIGIDAFDQAYIDEELHEIDGTTRFSGIGGNIAMAVSIATAKLAAKLEGSELYEYIFKRFTEKIGISKKIPRPLGNLIGGGVHSNGKMSIQEILIAADGGSLAKNAAANIETHRMLGAAIARLGCGVNIEGAWITPFREMKNLKLAKEAAERAGRKLGVKIRMGVDFAASKLYSKRMYSYGSRRLTREQQVSFVEKLVERFDLEYIEDPMNEDDFSGFAEINRAVGHGRYIVGDDLYATDVARLRKGISMQSTNSILIKVNQIGTLSDTIATLGMAHSHGIRTIVSHRSGETDDTFIAHLAVAFGSDYIKCGIVRGERIAKINELLRIEALEKQKSS